MSSLKLQVDTDASDLLRMMDADGNGYLKLDEVIDSFRDELEDIEV